jgi:hypothetical protein
MATSEGPVIDMTPDGAFIEPPKPTFGSILLRLAAFGVFLCIAGLLFWTVLFLIPVLLVLGVVGYFFARTKLRGTSFTVYRN